MALFKRVKPVAACPKCGQRMTSHLFWEGGDLVACSDRRCTLRSCDACYRTFTAWDKEGNTVALPLVANTVKYVEALMAVADPLDPLDPL